MNREEILNKAKNENKDEMEIAVRDKSMWITYIVMVLVAAVFTYFRAEKGESIMDLTVMICASVASGQFYRFTKIKEKSCLLLGVIALCVAIFALVRFCLGY